MDRFIVSRRQAGLGDGIVSLVPAWHFARKTGRTLIIDWRNSFYMKDRRHNGFPTLFEPMDEMGGVPVIADERVNQLRFPSSMLARNSFASYLEVAADWVYRKIFSSEMPYTLFWKYAQKYELKFLKNGRDSRRQYILFKTCISDVPVPLEDTKELLRHLKPKKQIQARIDEFLAKEFAARKVIAVHVRHGNGGDIMAHSKHWIDPKEAYRVILDAITQAKEELGTDALVFLCTDSVEVETTLTASIPKLITRGKFLRERGAGELHGKGIAAKESAQNLGEDALIEMFLLAKSDSLLCYPPGSFFTHYARHCDDGPSTVRQLSALAP